MVLMFTETTPGQAHYLPDLWHGYGFGSLQLDPYPYPGTHVGFRTTSCWWDSSDRVSVDTSIVADTCIS